MYCSVRGPRTAGRASPEGPDDPAAADTLRLWWGQGLVPGAGLFILRAKRPDIVRPYRAFGYPFLPLLYIVLCCGVMVLLLLSPTTRTEAVSGLLLVLIGIPVFYLWRRADRPASAQA